MLWSMYVQLLASEQVTLLFNFTDMLPCIWLLSQQWHILSAVLTVSKKPSFVVCFSCISCVSIVVMMIYVVFSVG